MSNEGRAGARPSDAADEAGEANPANPANPADPAAPELRPVPGSARGRGRRIVDLATDLVPRPARRRAGVFRRAMRRELVRIRDRKRITAIVLLAVVFALAAAGMVARGEAAGADARAYWAGVRIWIDGGNPYSPTGIYLPYVYTPWMLPLFAPWALMPWDAAWYAWRGGTILLLLWSIRWAYARRPLPTAILVAILAFPIAANLDTGNITLLLALMLFGAQFAGPRLAGFAWGLATWMKWVPAPIWLVLAPRARAWGLGWLVVAVGLSLATLPLTIIQLQTLFGFGERPLRLDYLCLVWSIVPWWWRTADPFAFFRVSAWRAWTSSVRRRVAAAGRTIAADPRAARAEASTAIRAFLGLGSPG